MRLLKKMISAFLAICMVISMVPMVALATETDSAQSVEGRIIMDQSVGSSVWIDGIEYAVQSSGGSNYVDLPAGTEPGSMVTYSYHVGDADDVHTQYPVSMQVWALNKNADGSYTPEKVEELNNILQYSGSSIRITGKKGIRMITSIEQNKKNDLTSGGLGGYKLLEYGTVLAWSDDLAGDKPLVLGLDYAKSNYAYKKGVADPVFAYEGNLMQYTNVLVDFTMDECIDDVAMRSYIILEDESGEQITIYGGIVHRSIGYIAWQNKDVFTPGSAAYNYVWEIIRHVYAEVTFETNGGSEIESAFVHKGNILEKPADPEKEGFAFGGWYKDEALTEAFDFAVAIEDNLTLYAKWDANTASDDDNDGVPNELEELLGTSNSNGDSDNDGIDDYTELYIIGSNPCIDDSNEDQDDDGLTNYDEVHKHKTNPAKPDTDLDGITDGDEINTYGTNPFAIDSDSDKLNDGDELELGLNPLVSDNVLEINQNITSKEIEESLLSNNDAIPNISGYADGKLTELVNITESDNHAISENRAVIGKGVEIDLVGEATLTLSFDVPDTSESLYIMYLSDDEGWVFLETESNTDVIWTEITTGGTYCVMDLNILLPLLGVDIDRVYDEVISFSAVTTSMEDELEPAKTEPVETESVETEPVETEPVETEPVETEPVETEPVETEPAVMALVETEPVETEPAETEPVETEPVETEPAVMALVETEPVETELVETEPVETEPVETEPVETEPVETEPVETEPVETEPIETEPVETEPVETEPIETTPIEIEPAETEPAKADGSLTLDQENSTSGGVTMDEEVIKQLAALMYAIAPMADEGEVMGQADIVFAIDTTGSMSDEISNVANNIATFVQRLTTEYNVNANFALIDYRDITADGTDSTVVVKNGSSNWYTNAATFASMIADLYVDGGGDTPETAVDALDVSRNLNFRGSAKKFIILVTDAGYKVNNNYGIASMEQEISLLQSQGIVTSVVTSSSYQDDYQALYEGTGGIYANIYGNFATELLKLADLIGAEVNEGNWILLDSFEHIALENPLSETSGDTDLDGVSDYNELTHKVAREFTNEVKKELTKRGIPQELIDKYFLDNDGIYVTMYAFKSNPVLPDTDFDGIGDYYDNAPRNNVFKGELSTEQCDSAATYTFNYRDFFANNTVYNKSLSTTSLLFSTFIYQDGGYSYNTPVVSEHSSGLVGSIDVRSLMEVHGFEDIVIYDLAAEYRGGTNSNVTMCGYTDDDITEVAIGHHEVTYNGVTKDVVAVVVRGTNGTIEEWSSNFEIGDLSKFSTVEDWKNPDNHRGFDVASNRILSKLNEYVQKYTTASATYWVMGHSRGAAIANIISANLVNSGKEVFGYTFAAPNTTVSSTANAAKYNCIFNLVNKDDFVPCVPMPGWDFTRYGQTAELDVTSKMEKEWHDLTGISWYNQMSEENLKELVDALTSAANGWGSCYTYTCDCADHGNGTADDITERGINDIYAIPERVRQYCKYTPYDSWFGSTEYEVCQLPAYFMQALADIITTGGLGDKAWKVVSTYQFADRYEHARNKIVSASVIGGIECPHYCSTYYLLTQYADASNF